FIRSRSSAVRAAPACAWWGTCWRWSVQDCAAGRRVGPEQAFYVCLGEHVLLIAELAVDLDALLLGEDVLQFLLAETHQGAGHLLAGAGAGEVQRVGRKEADLLLVEKAVQQYFRLQ